jgi:hypothetical protein
MNTPPQIVECEEYLTNGLENDTDEIQAQISDSSAANSSKSSKQKPGKLQNGYQTSFSNYNLLNTKSAGFNSNHHLNHYAANNSNNNSNIINGKSVNSNNLINHNHHHIQSFQSLSHMAMSESASMMMTTSATSARPISTMLMMKPLNRNSRRASMSELGYGKIESYNKLDKLGEVMFFE